MSAKRKKPESPEERDLGQTLERCLDGLAQEAGSQTICIKTMAGARAWAGVDTWKNPKKPTVNNDGLKLQPFEKCGSVTTGKGLFPIKVDGFFNMGNPLLVVTHNGKVMHSFDNGIPKDTAVSVRSNKVYTLRQAQKVMNRAQKHAYKAAMLHQQLLEKRTVRLAAKRLQRAWLQSQTGQTHANNSRLESDFAPRHARARRMLQLANKRSRRLRLLLESNLPRALDRGAAAVTLWGHCGTAVAPLQHRRSVATALPRHWHGAAAAPQHRRSR